MEPPIKRTKFFRYAALAGGALFALAGGNRHGARGCRGGIGSPRLEFALAGC